MRQEIDFNSSQVIRVTEENVGGVLIHLKALKADSDVAVIAALNSIPLKIAVKRSFNTESVAIVDDYLDYVLRALHSGSTRYEMSIDARADGYLIKIPFDGCVSLRKGDEMTIEMKAPTSAFTSLSSANSKIVIETIPAQQIPSSVITVVRSKTYAGLADQINDTIGTNVAKVVLVHDLSADYGSSTAAKPTQGVIIEATDFIKDVSENLLIQENLDYLQWNPETDLQDLVLYNSTRVLQNVKLKAKFNKAVSASARVMMLQRQAV